MKFDLGLHRIAVGGKGPVFNQDFMTVRCRPVETHHHQMQIDGQRIHHHDFAGFTPDQLGHAGGQKLVIRHPRKRAVEMTFNAELLPFLQLGHYIVGGVRRLQTQRIATKIDAIGAVFGSGNVKPVAERRERILPIH